MSFFTRDECLQRLRAQLAAGKPIIGGGAGTGISAKCAEAGGIDLIIIYNSGRFRMAGRGSLSGLMPYGDANQIVLDMAREVLPVVRHTPVLAGVCGTDPFRIMRHFLREVRDAGFSGVQNFPTVGPIAEPEDAAYVLKQTRGVVGFFGASSIERLPTEVAITGCVRRFKEIALSSQPSAFS